MGHPCGAPVTGAVGQNADVAGSFYGHEYPLHLPGGSIGRGFVFGILSVKAMCGDLESTVE